MRRTLKMNILSTLAHWPDRALQCTDVFVALHEAAPATQESIRATLSTLIRGGWVERDGGDRGWYAITAAGLKAAQD